MDGPPEAEVEVARTQGSLFENGGTPDAGVLLRMFSAVVLDVKQTKARLKTLQEQQSELDKIIREEVFAPLGVRSMKTDLGTVSLRTDIRASGGGDRDAAVQALLDAGLTEYVKPNFNAQTVAAWVREQIGLARDELGDDVLAMTWDELVVHAIGEDLAQHLTVSEVPSLTFSPSKGA